MIARLFVLADFPVCIPSDAKFNVFESDFDGYKVRFFAPQASARCRGRNETVKVFMDGQEAVRTDVIQIEFFGRAFDRTLRPPRFDPPTAVIRKVIDSYVARLRRATEGAAIGRFEFPGGIWLLQYLDEDGSTLPQEDGKAGGVGASHIAGGAIGLTEQIWDQAHKLPADYVPPAWETLLLDAAHPGIPPGSAIVLAATALEVFISHVLNELGKAQTKPAGLWVWLNDRGDFRKEPSVEEQFDVLLKMYCGHSLKEDARLWEAFKNLKTVRNTFVHEGTIPSPSAGKPDAVKSLTVSAEEIIENVSQWMPPGLRWSKCRSTVKMRYSQPLFPFLDGHATTQ